MPRPRTVPDAVVLDAALAVVARLGPTQFTLADVAGQVGLSPATLLQRFGSKRGLLLNLAEQAARGAGSCFDAVRAEHKSPLKALFAAFRAMACLAVSPEVLANNLAFLQMDLTDPDFRKWAAVHSRATLAGFRSLLDDAIDAVELIPCDTIRLARLIQAASHGSLVSWALEQQGSAADWMLRDMETLLAPYRVAKSQARRQSGRRAAGTR